MRLGGSLHCLRRRPGRRALNPWSVWREEHMSSEGHRAGCTNVAARAAVGRDAPRPDCMRVGSSHHRRPAPSCGARGHVRSRQCAAKLGRVANRAGPDGGVGRGRARWSWRHSSSYSGGALAHAPVAHTDGPGQTSVHQLLHLPWISARRDHQRPRRRSVPWPLVCVSSSKARASSVTSSFWRPSSPR